MKLFIILASTFLLTFAAHAQTLSSFDGMSTSEVRNHLLSQESSDLAREYALKHQKTRKAANGFLIVSGMFAGAGVLTTVLNKSDSPSVGAAVAQAFTILLFAGATSLTLVTSLILHTVSRNHLYKAKNTYLRYYDAGSTAHLTVGFSFNF